MRSFASVTLAFVLFADSSAAQSNQNFSGNWKLNAARSEIQGATAAGSILKVEQNATSVSWSAIGQESVLSIYPLDGRTEKRQIGDSQTSTTTKWEGAALLVNTIVSGPQNHTVMERWTRSRDGNTLTIRRTIVRQRDESESLLVYNRADAVATASSTAPPANTQPAETVRREFVVDRGTRVLLRLTNSLNTKKTLPGDRVYLETAVPVFVDGRLLIPRGSYVTGTVTESTQAGRVKGPSALNLRFEVLTLPNGVTRDFRSRPASADEHGNLERAEGRIEGDRNKAGDVQTVGQTTAAGAGIGTIAGSAAGRYGLGAGIGAAAGAAAGLAGVLSSRGAGVVLPAGTTMELLLDRDLTFTEAELRGGVQ